MTELASLVRDTGASWLLWVVVLAFVAKALLQIAAESSPLVERTLGRLGRRWADKRDARQSQAETVAELKSLVADLQDQLARSSTEDLRTEIEQLSKQLKIVRWRAEMTDAYLVDDSDFHRDVALAGIGGLPEHTPFPEHERRWRQTHPRPA